MRYVAAAMMLVWSVCWFASPAFAQRDIATTRGVSWTLPANWSEGNRLERFVLDRAMSMAKGTIVGSTTTALPPHEVLGSAKRDAGSFLSLAQKPSVVIVAQPYPPNQVPMTERRARRELNAAAALYARMIRGAALPGAAGALTPGKIVAAESSITIDHATQSLTVEMTIDDGGDKNLVLIRQVLGRDAMHVLEAGLPPGSDPLWADEARAIAASMTLSPDARVEPSLFGTISLAALGAWLGAGLGLALSLAEWASWRRRQRGAATALLDQATEASHTSYGG